VIHGTCILADGCDMRQVLAEHFARVYKMDAPRDLFSPAASAKGDK